MALAKKPLSIGLVGAGVVGGGVYEILAKRRDDFLAVGADCIIKKICVRDVNKVRDFEIGAGTTIVGDVKEILDDPEIDCVLELMGGTGLAKDVVFGAISAGKHVVTANKALVAAYLPEIQSLLNEHPEVSFSYEAAVCGGIPIINTLQQDYLGDHVESVMGIMNGTTNFMLSKMEFEGAAYGDVLAEAQALGYAEADPTADVEGHDVQAKIALIAKLAYGTTVPVSEIPTTGISSIDAVDFEYAKMMNSTIKLLGTAKMNPGEIPSLSVYVSPVVVPQTHPVAAARGATNIVNVTSANLGSTSYVGPGAGRFPTANSVVSDVLRLAHGLTSKPFPVTTEVPLEPDYTSNFYLRISISDTLGIIRAVGEAAERNGVGIHSVVQNHINNPENVDFVVTTELCKYSEVQAMCDEIASKDFALAPPLIMSLSQAELTTRAGRACGDSDAGLYARASHKLHKEASLPVVGMCSRHVPSQRRDAGRAARLPTSVADFDFDFDLTRIHTQGAQEHAHVRKCRLYL
eukprot:CAMPEP_0182535504 /NCGR_PEP_ID=MMETSP1323-20130603/18041_1 /TAXON_ID=236787 /ORGANISM="Florenciella parvula, Strain RCC1693" /LENGTH=518 /DNA_ID=CAMNT_0024745639 /DNA_START=9 /DNA_END=1563 /DNA_ORIENTATION=+